ncbi:MAG: hypothetical protein H0X34_19015 [Chthoniobacterales bacterium]|nr:hypothetical protein [Chthoniobacterales bacterium]
MNANSFRAFASRGALLRRNLYGQDEAGDPQTFDYDDDTARDVRGYYTPIRYQRQLDELNMRDVHDLVIRIFKAELPLVELGKQFRFIQDGKEVVVRIDEIGSHPLNPEWVLGCKSLI